MVNYVLDAGLDLYQHGIVQLISPTTYISLFGGYPVSPTY